MSPDKKASASKAADKADDQAVESPKGGVAVPAPAGMDDLAKGAEKQLKQMGKENDLSPAQLSTLATHSQLHPGWIPEQEILDPNANPALRQIREASAARSDLPGENVPELELAGSVKVDGDKKK